MRIYGRPVRCGWVPSRRPLRAEGASGLLAVNLRREI
jgi:hypothetical protein